MTALPKVFDMAYAIRHDLQKLVTKEVPTEMLANRLSLFDEITKAASTTEKIS